MEIKWETLLEMEKQDFHDRIGRLVYIGGLNCDLELRPNQKRWFGGWYNRAKGKGGEKKGNAGQRNGRGYGRKLAKLCGR